MATQEPDNIKKDIDFQRLMTAAGMYRTKGDYKSAENYIIQALELKPGDLDAREFAADLLFARGEIVKASKHYKSLFSKEAPRASAEEKYAKAIIQISEGKRQLDLIAHYKDNPRKTFEHKRNPIIAAVLSVAPGFGQVYNGQMIKGIVLFAISVFLWFLFSIARPDVANIEESKRTFAFFTDMSPLAVLLIVLSSCIQIYCLIDAVVTAEKASKSGM